MACDIWVAICRCSGTSLRLANTTVGTNTVRRGASGPLEWLFTTVDR
jgi:hypothetical protein